jgi:hypothetical protein
MSRFNIDLDSETLHKFKEIAVKRRTTMSDITRDFINNYIIIQGADKSR